jgi:hypothetical protein
VEGVTCKLQVQCSADLGKGIDQVGCGGTREKLGKFFFPRKRAPLTGRRSQIKPLGISFLFCGTYRIGQCDKGFVLSVGNQNGPILACLDAVAYSGGHQRPRGEGGGTKKVHIWYSQKLMSIAHRMRINIYSVDDRNRLI